MLSSRSSEKPGGNRHYMIDLNRWRSRAALLASIITLAATIYAIVNGLILYAKDNLPVLELYQFFTPNANTLTGLAAAFIIPYAVEGIRKKRFTYPKWVAMLHYSGTICTTLTMVFSVCLISFYDREAAFGGNNFYLHIICPALVLFSFFLVESDYHYTQRDSFICLIPACIYVAVYLWKVVIVGAENGGWEDLYHMTDYLPVFITLPGILLLAFIMSALIRRLSNKKTSVYRKKMTSLWTDDLDPVEIKIEAYGLGRYAGKSAEESNVPLPLDIIRMLAGRYNLKTEELIRAYIKGVADGLTEKETRSSGRNDKIF